MSIYFTEDHEWIKVDGDIGTVGISPYAAKQLGDVVFVELPEIGREMDKGDEAAVVESVKAASEVYAPVGGEVTEVNTVLEDAPETVNASADGEGWFLKMKIADADELGALMDEAKYKDYCDGL
ncbi:glycine cleavage system H protein [Litorimonas cladophorae]|uniref:Glycine cleavage system H protein n=1 Tax=Litorimonas cladophorae TaxID=1220491 RepID=A0A918NG08_9PROT|nr:glycine cleavage system protein GcvH [Litorimonas cladophorae]GGX64426.1 glycine cleavage system H protein [Litorimonas cladophorae]